MDLGSINAIDTISPAQRDLQRLERYCVRCRSHGHEIQNCSQGPHISEKLVAAVLDEDDYNDGSASEGSGLNIQDYETLDRLDWRKRV